MSYHPQKTRKEQKLTEHSFKGKTWSVESFRTVFAIISTIAQIISLGMHIAESMDKHQPEVRNVVQIQEQVK